jgi:hypothetical protein
VRRLWFGTSVVVAAAVAATLLLTDRAKGRGGAGAVARPPPALRDADLRVYIEAAPLQYEWVAKMRDAHLRGEALEPLRDRMEAELHAVALKHQRSRDDLHEIRRRVEAAVDAIRFERNVGGHRATLEARMKECERQLEGARGEFRVEMEKQRDLYREQIRRRIEAASPADKALVLTYWDTLDAIVPRTFGG